eukprot:280689_1
MCVCMFLSVRASVCVETFQSEKKVCTSHVYMVSVSMLFIHISFILNRSVDIFIDKFIHISCSYGSMPVLLDWDNELTQLILKQKTNSNDSNNIIFEEKA